jgi:hypothetical protein
VDYLFFAVIPCFVLAALCFAKGKVGQGWLGIAAPLFPIGTSWIVTAVSGTDDIQELPAGAVMMVALAAFAGFPLFVVALVGAVGSSRPGSWWAERDPRSVPEDRVPCPSCGAETVPGAVCRRCGHEPGA